MGAELAALLADPSLSRRQSEAGRRAVLERYAPAAHVERLVAIFARASA
jgi:hypothetical protein